MTRTSTFTGTDGSAWNLSSGSWTHVTESGTFQSGPTATIVSNQGNLEAAAETDVVRRHHADSTYTPRNAEVRCKFTVFDFTHEMGIILKASSTSADANYYLARNSRAIKTGSATAIEIAVRNSSTYTRIVADTAVFVSNTTWWLAFRSIERASDVLLQAKIWNDGGSEPAWPAIVMSGSVTANPSDGVVQAVDSTSGLWNSTGGVGLWSKIDRTAVSFVSDRGSAQNLTASASTAVDLASGASITTNNYLIARIAMDNAGSAGAAPTLSVTDPRSNTWTVTAASNQDPGAVNTGITGYIAYAKVTNAYSNGDDITFNHTPNPAAKAVIVEEWRNIHGTTPLAVAAIPSNGASGTPSVSRTPLAGGQLVYGSIAIEGPSGDTYTQDSDTTDGSWATLTSLSTTDATATNNATVRGAYKVVSGVAAQTWNPTITSRDWAQLLMVFDQTEDTSVSTQRDDFSAIENAVVAPPVIAAVTTATTPVVSDGPAASSIAAISTVPAPGIGTGDIAEVIVATSSVPAPSLSAGATVTLDVITAIAAPIDPEAIGGATTAEAEAIVCSATVPSPALSAGLTVDTIAVASTVAAVTVSAGSTATPDAIAATVTVTTPDFSAIDVQDVIAAVSTVPSPSIETSTTPSTIAATVTVPDPTITQGANVLVAAVTAVSTLEQPGIVTGDVALVETPTITCVSAVGGVPSLNTQDFVLPMLATLVSSGRSIVSFEPID